MPPSFETKLVVVARKDLKLSAGKLAAQVGHASVDCALKAKRHQPDVFDRWHAEGQKKVVVKAEKEADLFRLKLEAEKLGLTTALIADAGHTELPAGTITVLGVGPGREQDVDRVTGSLALY
ncbi:MAG TPA: peptidyl-tRNA hydrolase Pth2 [Candidatus Thermoplasmatota archaeon]|nr:peptidyl-tRNA hydrolase Pth2 [Candidatus Thermoplasmatota archaeon]